MPPSNLPQHSPPGVRASLDLHIEWPTHGRSLQLGEVDVRPGEPVETVLDHVWHELSRVADELGVANPAAFRAVRIEWQAPDGRVGRVLVHPDSRVDPALLQDELVASLGLELTQFGFEWAGARGRSEMA